MSITDPIKDLSRPFEVDGWSSGKECSPPEPGKHWLTIVDSEGKEVCIVVHRGDTDENGDIDEDGIEVLLKVNLAFSIAAALNARYPT